MYFQRDEGRTRVAVDDRFGELATARVGAPGPRSLPAAERAEPSVSRLLAKTVRKLEQRAGQASGAAEGRRFAACAERLEAIAASVTTRRMLNEPRIARELGGHLDEWLGASEGADRAASDALLRAAATAVQLSLGLSRWRSSPSVPAPVKELLTAERVYGSIRDIERLQGSEPLACLLGRYGEVVSALAGDGSAGVRLEVRNPALWMWCKFNIRNVTYRFRPSAAAIAPQPRIGDEARAERLYEAVADAKVMLVLFNVLLDDVADNLQDAELLDVMARIPTAGGRFGTASPEAYDALRAELVARGRSRFSAYLDLSIEVWVTALAALRALLGDSFDALAGELARDYQLVVQSMRLSVDLNRDPRGTFYLCPDELERRYGSRSIGDILSHNANLSAFLTLDLMCLRHLDPWRHEEVVASGAAARYRSAILVAQDMLQIGNSVATGVREIDSDDLSNELFQIANDLLNERGDWQLPEHLAAVPGMTRDDALLRAFDRRKAIRRGLPAGADADAEREYAALGEDIQQLYALSGADKHYLDKWLARRDQLARLLGADDRFLDVARLRRGDDLLLVTHLLYKGKI